MKEPLISFIIPAYNVPVALLKECVGSVLALSMSDDEHEIIVVDDGSDAPLDVAMLGCSTEVTLIRQPHKGLSAARNTGVKASKGKYIQFVDSDDRLIVEPYNACISLVRSDEPDMIMFRFAHKTGPSRRSFLNFRGTGSEYMRDHNIGASACCYVFRKTILCDLSFDERVLLHEDELFTPQLLLRCKRLYTTEAAAYFYRISAESMTNTAVRAKILLRLDSAESVIKRLHAIVPSLSGTDKDALARRVAQITMDLLYNTISLTSDRSRLEATMERLKSDDLYPLPHRCYTLKYSLFCVCIEVPLLRNILFKMIRR